MRSLTQSLTSQMRLVWEAEVDSEVADPVLSDDQRAYAVAWRIHEAWAELWELDARPLLLGGKRRRKRRADAGSDPSKPFGVFPTRRDTVIAEVLARLLEGERLTGLDAVRACNATRLADKVHVLIRRFGWRIEDDGLKAPTQDRRVANVSDYGMSRAVIDAASTAGGAEFCTSVRKARAKLRAGAAPG